MKGSKGFTLLEVVIAMLILAVGLLGLTALQAVTVRGNSFATQVTEASTIAQDQHERLLATPFTALASGGPNSVTGATGVVYNVDWTVTPDGGGSHANVSVQITWEHDVPHSLRFDSVISEF
jgi:prepilin-type N-terminal cleavage/methylation domain-containing protein